LWYYVEKIIESEAYFMIAVSPNLRKAVKEISSTRNLKSDLLASLSTTEKQAIKRTLLTKFDNSKKGEKLQYWS